MAQLEGGPSALGICAFCYMLNVFGVVVFHRSMVHCRGALSYIHSAICETYLVQWYSLHLWSIGWGYICPKYICILLYVKLIRCSSYSIYLWSKAVVGTYALSICALCYMLNVFSVLVFHTSMVSWRKGTLVYVHSAICETYLVQQYSIHLWSIAVVGYSCPKYMCILLYVKHIQCSGIPWIYGQLEGALVYVHSSICETYVLQQYSIHLWLSGGGTSALSICAFCYMWNLCGVAVFHTSMVNWRGTFALSMCAFCHTFNLFGVVVFHRSMVNWRRGPWCMCILLSMKHSWVQWYSIHLWSDWRQVSICPKYICILL